MFINQSLGRRTHATSGIGACPGNPTDHHAFKVRRGGLVAEGRGIRDIVGDRCQFGGIGVQAGHAGTQRGGNRHKVRLSAASTPSQCPDIATSP